MSYTVQAAEPDASPTSRGVVTTGAQSFAGQKTFTGGVQFPNNPVNLGPGVTLTNNTSTEPLAISASQSGVDAFRASNAGARWKIGPGTTDYLSSDGATKISAAGRFGVQTSLDMAIGSDIRWGTQVLYTSRDYSGLMHPQIQGHTASGSGRAVLYLSTVNTLAATEDLLRMFNGGADVAPVVLAVKPSGTIESGVADGGYLLRTATVATGIWRNASATQLNFDSNGVTALSLNQSAALLNSPWTFRSDAGSGSNGFLLNVTGARLKLSSAGTTDYLSSDGATKITAAGGFEVAGSLAVNGARLDVRSAAFTNFTLGQVGDAVFQVDTNGNTLVGQANGGVEASLTMKMGTSNGAARAVGTLSVNTTQVGNVGTGEDDLMTYALPADSLKTNGRGVASTFSGTTANNGNAKTLKVYWGTAVIATLSLTISQLSPWRVEMEVIRTGASAQRVCCRVYQAGTLQQCQIINTTATETETAATTIKCTGTGTSNDDIVQNLAVHRSI